MADTAILTACFGGYDDLHPQAEQDIEVDWIRFSDESSEARPWELHVENRDGNPNLTAKCFKLLPPLAHRHVIWIDANMEITSPSFAREALAHIHDGLALFAHPRRDCIYEEARASLGAESQGGRYDDLPISEQVEHYRREGHPEHAGLYACGTIAWDLADPRAKALGSRWLEECRRWSYQDQLSFPVVCRRLGIEPGLFPFPQLERRMRNRWLTIHPHLS